MPHRSRTAAAALQATFWTSTPVATTTTAVRDPTVGVRFSCASIRPNAYWLERARSGFCSGDHQAPPVKSAPKSYRSAYRWSSVFEVMEVGRGFWTEVV
ncbi:uncharacterized protein MYCGRDRAFT_106046 [Zymoseptoria tritici IPO323]|uniref:Uncharacterized protein n=1 Tax=Zymoseptoria tritici (strain CBS 115943 / IPO323) TaxID=336722 RepID=F9XMG3_ZYMTI|nr:uncharacterized protein MYCGRDRAFT_106046 [Zymoseptoria tritici IPO323]EGP83706.1 hypothetical protein MYCGRDRAFT_106046 [Zymoseptoria tritici IPO323]